MIAKITFKAMTDDVEAMKYLHHKVYEGPSFHDQIYYISGKKIKRTRDESTYETFWFMSERDMNRVEAYWSDEGVLIDIEGVDPEKLESEVEAEDQETPQLPQLRQLNRLLKSIS